MDNQQLYDELANMKSKLNDAATNFSQIHGSLIELMEKNAELEIENQHLRERIEQLSDADEGKQVVLSSSKQNLEKLYNEGFHICNDYYGKRRENGESCLLCINLLDMFHGKLSKE